MRLRLFTSRQRKAIKTEPMTLRALTAEECRHVAGAGSRNSHAPTAVPTFGGTMAAAYYNYHPVVPTTNRS